MTYKVPLTLADIARTYGETDWRVTVALTYKHLIRQLSLSTYFLPFYLAVSAGSAAQLNEPLTLSSENGVLDILMIAKAEPIHTLPSAPMGWVYEICKRSAANLDACPSSNSASNYYGGTLLHLSQGDTLRIHFVNQLPPVLDSDHASEPGHEFLGMNPTNLHTHGMLVAPRKPSADNPTYGDNIFVLTFNSLNGRPEVSPHMHADIRYDFTDYEIKIPVSHPSGLFWFHPHAHGIALNQVSAGLGGVITVGDLSDYVCKDSACANTLSQTGVRHIVLKDTQILANGKMQTQEDPDFCSPARAKGETARQGSCAGQNNSSDDGTDYSGGSWFFTLNGQVYPTIPVQSGAGEIWRITNESGSATYDLKLWNPSQGRNMMFQVLSLDGVSVRPTPGMSNQQKAEISGGKLMPEACPAGIAAGASGDEALCTRKLHMMPSSRAEVWVTYRDSNDKLASPPNGAHGVFRTVGYQTGTEGDSWPAVDLARVNFGGSLNSKMPQTLEVSGDAITMLTPTALSSSMTASNQAVAADASCKPLPPGHMRRIFYSVPTNNMDAFGLAYEEVDAQGQVVGAPATDVTPFDPMYPTVCVPLGPGNTPVTERWQLVNVAAEDHNFHIHQVKFRVLSQDEIGGTVLPGQIAGKGVMLDNVPLPHANGVCGNNPPDDLSNPIADWRAGLCTANVITVEIPFAIAGDFVYHCHILEHEDGGMMARIRVRRTK